MHMVFKGYDSKKNTLVTSYYSIPYFMRVIDSRQVLKG